jgi:hypothetical protein
MISYVLTYTCSQNTHTFNVRTLQQGDDSDNDGGVVDLLDGAMVRNLKLVGGSDDEDSDLEGEEVELQVGEDGKLIVPGTCTHTHLKCKQLRCLPFRDMIDSQSLWRRSLILHATSQCMTSRLHKRCHCYQIVVVTLCFDAPLLLTWLDEYSHKL